jgi:hypothetical protein
MPLGLFLQAEALEALVEARKLAAAVDEALLAAGPGRVGFRIDLEAQRVAGLAVGRPRLLGRAVGHDDRDLVIVRMNAVFHRRAPRKVRLYSGASARVQLASRRRVAGEIGAAKTTNDRHSMIIVAR